MITLFIFSFASITALLFGLNAGYISIAWEWAGTHLKEVLIASGVIIAGGWKWYNTTRHRNVADGATAQLVTTKALDDRFKILDNRIDELTKESLDDSKLIRKLQLELISVQQENSQLSNQQKVIKREIQGLRKFVWKIKDEAPALYNKHKHELD